MSQSRTDSTKRFSNRVENYVRYRPGYPEDVLHILREETGLTPDAVVADVGSGTGISAELFLRNGNPVLGVEPNPHMRSAAEEFLRHYPEFQSVSGTAEATKLPDESVDYVVAAQAFHWFDPTKARQEFGRILRAGGWVVLLWNTRRTVSTPFLRAYEDLLRRFGTDYCEIQYRSVDHERLRSLFTEGNFETRRLFNEQQFDFEGLKGRLLSASYTPTEEHPNYRPMLRDLERIFEAYSERGLVRFEYDTEMFFGHLV